jgi:hypothetical protein
LLEVLIVTDPLQKQYPYVLNKMVRASVAVKAACHTEKLGHFTVLFIALNAAGAGLHA